MGEEWIEWKGGKCPLAPGIAHEVRLRSGEEIFDDNPETWRWRHLPDTDDIIAYRVLDRTK